MNTIWVIVLAHRSTSKKRNVNRMNKEQARVRQKLYRNYKSTMKWRKWKCSCWQSSELVPQRTTWRSHYWNNPRCLEALHHTPCKLLSVPTKQIIPTASKHLLLNSEPQIISCMLRHSVVSPHVCLGVGALDCPWRHHVAPLMFKLREEIKACWMNLRGKYYVSSFITGEFVCWAKRTIIFFMTMFLEENWFLSGYDHFSTSAGFSESSTQWFSNLLSQLLLK